MTTHDESGWGTAPSTSPPGERAPYLTTREPATDDSMKDAAAQQGGELASHAKDSAQQVAAVAGDRAGDVKDEAIAQTKHVYHQARGQLADHATTQLQQASTGLHDLADELERMAGFGGSGVGTSLVSEAAARAHDAAAFLDGRRVEDVLEDVRRFARRRPGAFLLGAAGLGLLAGRLARGAKDAGNDNKADRGDTADWGDTADTGGYAGRTGGLGLSSADPYPAATTQQLPVTPTLAETNLQRRDDPLGGELR